MKISNRASVLLAICLSSCATPTPPASDAEKMAAVSDYVNCLRMAAERLDDGKSDATRVGLAIEPMCAQQFSKSIETNGRDLNPAAFELFVNKERQDQLQFAIETVFRVRSLRAQQSSN